MHNVFLKIGCWWRNTLASVVFVFRFVVPQITFFLSVFADAGTDHDEHRTAASGTHSDPGD